MILSGISSGKDYIYSFDPLLPYFFSRRCGDDGRSDFRNLSLPVA